MIHVLRIAGFLLALLLNFSVLSVYDKATHKSNKYLFELCIDAIHDVVDLIYSP